MFRNFQLHTRHNQNSYFGEGNEDDQYPPGLSEIVMYGDDHTLSESTRLVVMSICTKIEFVQ
jgi:hypothetical protein